MTHECIHEDTLIGQSRAIERLSAELNYKKERLDDLKEDNKRMEDKIDKISTSVNSLVNQSNEKDSQLDIRLTAYETRMSSMQKRIDDDKKESNARFNRGISLLAIGLTVLDLVLFVFLR